MNNLVNAFDCCECALKHVSKARCQVMEYRQDPIYELELINAIGNLGCAEDHLLEKHEELAAAVRACRHLLENGIFDLAPIDHVAIQIANLTDIFTKNGDTSD